MPEPESPLRLDTAFDEMDRLRKELGGAFEDPERTPTLKMDALYSELLTAINRPSRCLAMFKDWTNDR
jgi:hypothetical protein